MLDEEGNAYLPSLSAALTACFVDLCVQHVGRKVRPGQPEPQELCFASRRGQLCWWGVSFMTAK